MKYNDMNIIDAFEKQIAEYAGAKYGVAVSSGTNAIFLCLEYLKSINEIKCWDYITIPNRTYVSVPMSIMNSAIRVKFNDIKWSGCYQLKPTRVYDSTVRFKKNMYIKDSLYCLSFQYRKHLPIGRGGMILTDSKNAYDKLRRMRHNSKTPDVNIHDDKFYIMGWDMYMTPEQAARGLTLFNAIHNKDLSDCGCQEDYPDVSKQLKMNPFA